MLTRSINSLQQRIYLLGKGITRVVSYQERHLDPKKRWSEVNKRTSVLWLAKNTIRGLGAYRPTMIAYENYQKIQATRTGKKNYPKIGLRTNLLTQTSDTCSVGQVARKRIPWTLTIENTYASAIDKDKLTPVACIRGFRFLHLLKHSCHPQHLNMKETRLMGIGIGWQELYVCIVKAFLNDHSVSELS